MKLINKTLFYYLLISLPLLAVAGVFSYFLIKSELRDGTDESLLKEKFEAERMIASFQEPHGFVLCADSLSYITIIPDKQHGDIFSDTILYDVLEKELIPYRILKSFYFYKNTNYQITILKTTIEQDELMEGLLSSFALIISFLVVAFFIVSWLLSKTVWKPFYKTLNKLNVYDVKNNEQQLFPPEKIAEFNQLNEALNRMTNKLNVDFIQQKEFIENASHEMQTPLAVVKANVSLLMQSSNLKEQEMLYLQAIENTTKKMASLNKALLLLSKIENNQFSERETISFKSVIEKVLANFSELIQSKKMELELNLINDLHISINPILADVLATNVIHNAIRHNIKGGKICVSITGNILEVCNNGEPLSISSEDLFVRFKKNDTSKDSLGLGLSIVKGITQYYNFNISYSFKNDLHSFILKF
jgi:signal transduction histidine kinase